jgi:hypothetical protein
MWRFEARPTPHQVDDDALVLAEKFPWLQRETVSTTP